MFFSSFNSIDLAVIGIIGVSILIGILRGATREVLGIAGWIGAFAVVFYGLPLFRPLGRQYIHSPMVADLVIAGVLFIISLAVFILISRLISSSVKGSMLGGLDRSLGLVFGLVRGVLVVCLAYLTMSFFYQPKDIPQSVATARFMPWIAKGALELKHLIPKDYLPRDLKQATTIDPLDAKDLLENSLPNLEETVKNLSTLKPTSPLKAPPVEEKKEDLEKLIETNEAETER
ncbi:MAG TPA: CvpA family protein [Alphaproteobacteria bacterium]|nr:CvpA family protein [Alphaproteobacteria bacterium]